MKPTSIRFHEIDLLRGLACVSVIAFHFLSSGPRFGGMQIAGIDSIDGLTRYGYLGVHLFFMISGFVILLSVQGATPRSFAASRAARLLPALWAGVTITALTAWALHDGRYHVPLLTYLINLPWCPTGSTWHTSTEHIGRWVSSCTSIYSSLLRCAWDC